MIKIEKAEENWIARIGRSKAVIKPAELKDLASAVNTIIAMEADGITAVAVDAGNISITMPVDKVGVLKANMEAGKPEAFVQNEQ